MWLGKLQSVKSEAALLVRHLLVVFTPQVQQLCLCSVQSFREADRGGKSQINFKKIFMNFDLKATLLKIFGNLSFGCINTLSPLKLRVGFTSNIANMGNVGNTLEFNATKNSDTELSH